MNMLNKLKVKFIFKASEIKIIQDVDAHLSRKRLPAQIEDVIFVNEILLVLKKFENIRVKPNKKTYTKTLYISDFSILLQLSYFFAPDSIYEHTQWQSMAARVDKAIENWETEVHHYKESKYKQLESTYQK